MKKITMFLLLLSSGISLYAQTKVTGFVLDGSMNYEPLIGATVMVKGTNTGTTTDVDGNFSLTMPEGATQLQVSSVGYTTQVVTVGKQKTLKITLYEDSKVLEEMVVVGYGEMKRSDLTGSVASIGEKLIKQGVNTSLEQSMQGRIAGVQVMQNSGAPGGGISVQIRGINSLGGNEPLYVIDGIAMSGQTDANTSVMSSLNPSDITSIEVLKDASATAIYGSRASNGVVLITTKRGQEGKAKVNYEGMAGWQKLPKQLDMMNLKQYASFYNERAALWGWGEMEQYKDVNLLTNGTDWQDVLFRTAFMQQHQLGVSGGTRDMTFNLSGGYLDQEGIGIGSEFTRASFRTNIETKVNDWLRVGANGYFARTQQVVTFDDASVISTALSQTPDMAAYTPDGSFDTGAENEFNYSSNPLFDATMRDNHTKKSQLDFNLFANITPVKGLTLRVEYGGSFSWSDNYYFVPAYTYGSDNLYSVESQSTRTSATSKYKNFKIYATYDRDLFDKFMHMQVMAGHEAQWGNWANLSAGRKGYISDAIHSLNVGDASTATNDEQGDGWAIESYFGRLNINIRDRYLLTGTLRYDGSTSFGKGKKWGTFPSAALAWKLSNESFMDACDDWLKNAKVRAGWGLVGNQNAATYAYGVAMGTTPTAWGTGYYPANYANPKLKWESTRAWNLGIDISVLENRIEFIVDTYLKKTDDLLMRASLPSYVVDVDGYRGIAAQYVNTGAIENKGIEFTLNTVNMAQRNFQWRSGLTLSMNRNKLTKLNSDDSQIFGTVGSSVYTMSEVGGPVGRFYGYNCIGMFTCESDFYQKNRLGEFLLDQYGDRLPVARPVDSNGTLYPIGQNYIWVGDYIFEDVNGDGKITESDRKFIGDPNPDFTFGINNSFTYRNFELNIFINGSYGNDVYNVLRQDHTDPSAWGNKMAYAANYAKIGLIDPNGSASDISNVYITNASTAAIERISPSGTNVNANERVSTRFVEDGSYLRLKTISLAYNVPTKWLQRAKIEWLQVYANAQNLFTITGYDGYDPEVGAIGQSVILQGIDNGRYPSQRIYNVGLKMTF
ncbi:MAG: TonB-dependent receptor [Bacteroidales bacterium]|jgi:TonB-linked SusC/RagA family outer membrane protein|nr:TonB-dependent receptor [Bacteroidales bacterium]